MIDIFISEVRGEDMENIDLTVYFQYLTVYYIIKCNHGKVKAAYRTQQIVSKNYAPAEFKLVIEMDNILQHH